MRLEDEKDVGVEIIPNRIHPKSSPFTCLNPMEERKKERKKRSTYSLRSDEANVKDKLSLGVLRGDAPSF